MGIELKHTLIKKVFINILCVLTVVSAGFSDVSAEDISRITILGDSISSGYGLSENDRNYGGWLGEYFGAEVRNFAAVGETTSQLMDIIETDSEVVESLENADLICVSIGGNDILDIFYEDLKGIADGFSVSRNGNFSVSPESIEKLILSFSSSLGPASAEAGKNIGEISDRITEINPEARLVFQTVYNPFETDDESMKSLYTPLYTFTSIYLSAINNAVKSNDKIAFADIQNKFRGNCPQFTNIAQMDIHPNRVGHLIIAEEIVQQLKIPGENMIFSRELGAMVPEPSEIIPEELIYEIEMLAQGEFRKEENASEEKETQPEEETAAETQTTETEQAEENVNEKNHSMGGIIAVIAAVLLVVIIVILIKIKKNNRREKL